MKEYKIELEPPTLEEIESISIVLENCDVIEVFQNEIEGMDLQFDSKLELSGNGIVRQLRSGELRINIKDKYNIYRNPLIGMPIRRKHPKTDELIQRLQCACDVTHLEIVRKSDCWRETILVPYEELEDEETGTIISTTVCSSAKVHKDGKLSIFMGEKSEYIPN